MTGERSPPAASAAELLPMPVHPPCSLLLVLRAAGAGPQARRGRRRGRAVLGGWHQQAHLWGFQPSIRRRRQERQAQGGAQHGRIMGAACVQHGRSMGREIAGDGARQIQTRTGQRPVVQWVQWGQSLDLSKPFPLLRPSPPPGPKAAGRAVQGGAGARQARRQGQARLQEQGAAQAAVMSGGTRRESKEPHGCR